MLTLTKQEHIDQVASAEAIVDPRDGYLKTAFYFNKFEDNKGYDCHSNDDEYVCDLITEIDPEIILEVNKF